MFARGLSFLTCLVCAVFYLCLGGALSLSEFVSWVGLSAVRRFLPPAGLLLGRARWWPGLLGSLGTFLELVLELAVSPAGCGSALPLLGSLSGLSSLAPALMADLPYPRPHRISASSACHFLSGRRAGVPLGRRLGPLCVSFFFCSACMVRRCSLVSSVVPPHPLWFIALLLFSRLARARFTVRSGLFPLLRPPALTPSTRVRYPVSLCAPFGALMSLLRAP